MLPDQNHDQPVLPDDNLSNGNVGRAAFIVGALILDGVIHLDINSMESRQGVGDAIRSVVELLDATDHPDDDMPALPFVRNADDGVRWASGR